MDKITFLGLGNMGMPMAVNLVRAGFHVYGHDLVPGNLEQFKVAGGTPVTEPHMAVRSADVVVTMLPASGHVETAYLAESGVVSLARPGALLIDCSTIAPESARKVAAAAAERELAFVDAPVSGGTAGAAAGSLTFMVGGTSAAIERAKPYLLKMGKTVFHTGDSGSGQIVKICNNMLLGILMAGTSEAIRLGVANGMDPKVLSDVMAQSSGRNWVLDTYNPCPGVVDDVPASRGYRGGFGVNLMLKDLGLAVESARLKGAAVPVGELVKTLYELHSDAGNGSLDFSSIFQLSKERRWP